jgi:hypothetical protein
VNNISVGSFVATLREPDQEFIYRTASQYSYLNRYRFADEGNINIPDQGRLNGRKPRAYDEDEDARFIVLWVYLNASHADEHEFQEIAPGERAAFVDYFGQLVALDQDRRI